MKTAIFRNCLIASLLIVGTAPPVLAAGITIANSATVTLVGSPTITTVSVGIYGTLSAGAGTIKISGNYTNIGTFTAGTGTVDFTATSGTQYLTSGGTGTGKLFYHLTHSGAGTLYLLTNAIDIDGNFNNSAGIFDANGLAISCAGNWTNSATATYTHNNNSVTLDGTNQTLTGPTTFYDLTKIVTSAATLTFDNTAIQTITHNLTLQGASGQLLSLRSDAAAAYNLTLQAGGTQSLSYLDVQYSDASGGVELAAGPTSVNSENNVNWTFLILSISVLPSTWGVGTVDVGTTQVTAEGSKVNVTNNGNVSETFTLRIYDEDDRDEWTHSSSETGAGSNVYVLSGIFCATSASPTGASFNEGDSDDVLTTSAQVATSSKFAYTGGGDDAVSVPASGQLSLWLRLDMPTAVTGTHAYDEHIITVRISCQQP